MESPSAASRDWERAGTSSERVCDGVKHGHWVASRQERTETEP